MDAWKENMEGIELAVAQVDGVMQCLSQLAEI